MPLGATVVFSSIAGRFGNSGQTDYSAANALLASMSSWLARRAPGDARDRDRLDRLGRNRHGDARLDPEDDGDGRHRDASARGRDRDRAAGARRRRRLRRDRRRRKARHPRRRVGRDRRPRRRPEGRLPSRRSSRPLVLRRAGSPARRSTAGSTVETTLDPVVQPFLFDHAIDGTPLLPGVMGIEAFAEVASALCPGFRVAAVEDVQFLDTRSSSIGSSRPRSTSRRRRHPTPRAISSSTPCSARRVQPKPDLPPVERLHFRARVRMTRTPAGLPAAGDEAAVDEDGSPLRPRRDLSRLLPRAGVPGSRGGRARTATRLGASWRRRSRRTPCPVRRFAHGAASHRALLPDGRHPGSGRERAPRAADGRRLGPGLRLRGGRGGPRLLGRRPARDGGSSFDADVVDERGRVFVELRGYRTVPLEGKVILA